MSRFGGLGNMLLLCMVGLWLKPTWPESQGMQPKAVLQLQEGRRRYPLVRFKRLNVLALATITFPDLTGITGRAGTDLCSGFLGVVELISAIPSFNVNREWDHACASH